MRLLKIINNTFLAGGLVREADGSLIINPQTTKDYQYGSSFCHDFGSLCHWAHVLHDSDENIFSLRGDKLYIAEVDVPDTTVVYYSTNALVLKAACWDKVRVADLPLDKMNYQKGWQQGALGGGQEGQFPEIRVPTHMIIDRVYVCETEPFVNIMRYNKPQLDIYTEEVIGSWEEVENKLQVFVSNLEEIHLNDVIPSMTETFSNYLKPLKLDVDKRFHYYEYFDINDFKQVLIVKVLKELGGIPTPELKDGQYTLVADPSVKGIEVGYHKVIYDIFNIFHEFGIPFKYNTKARLSLTDMISTYDIIYKAELDIDAYAFVSRLLYMDNLSIINLIEQELSISEIIDKICDYIQ